uniref:Dimethylarginine dimethylaminohydrolase a n=1 Tax=Branchiostoma belcheri TaxID=7741 RepID=Q0GK45_BRABE|nr:dimethylarginine dimethylaminohydrolase a [Branchiostoma belcheri]
MSTAKFTRAIVRQIPDSIRDHSEVHEYKEELGLPPNKPVDLEEARKAHAAYTQTLKDLGLEVTVLPADESLPDCPFVEDTCVIVGNRALLTRPESETRRGELDAVKKVLVDYGLEIHTVDDEEATLEGGDVFFTGHEIFVGESTCTNAKGIEFLRKTFPEYPVHSVPLAPPEFHLKGVACIAAPGVIALCESEFGITAWEAIQEKAKFRYEPLWTPDSKGIDDHTCDVIYFNGNLIHCTEKEGPESVKIFAEKFPHLNRVEATVGQLENVDAGLTCCSLIF